MIVHICSAALWGVVLTFSGSGHRACHSPSLLASSNIIFLLFSLFRSLTFLLQRGFLLFSILIIYDILREIISSLGIWGELLKIFLKENLIV